MAKPNYLFLNLCASASLRFKFDRIGEIFRTQNEFWGANLFRQINGKPAIIGFDEHSIFNPPNVSPAQAFRVIDNFSAAVEKTAARNQHDFFEKLFLAFGETRPRETEI